MTEMQEFLTQSNIFMLLGGLGVFLFGIKIMGESLKSYAGDSLRSMINRFTNNKYSAVLTGALATVAIQSSSGTSALTISLVRAGLMELSQAIGVIMGANIGTTVTAFLLSLNIKSYALVIIFVGAMIYMFSQARKKSLIGQIIFGFGMLFYGMTLMETPLKLLAKTDGFQNVMATVAENPILGLAIGTLLTIIVQSSSATIGVLQGLYLSNAITFPIAFAILLGDNLGTTITSLLSSIGGSRDSVRAAISHVVFNLFGSILFFIIMYGFGGIVPFEDLVTGIIGDDKPAQIALCHFFFNVTVTAILIWFIPQIESFVKFVVPQTDAEKKTALSDHFLDDALIETAPTMALQQAEAAVVELARTVNLQLNVTNSYAEKGSNADFNHIDQLELGINALDARLKLYLQLLSNTDLVEKDNLKLSALMYTINDLESVGDLAVNVASKLHGFAEQGEKLSPAATEEVSKMLSVALSISKNSIQLLETEDPIIAGKILEKEKHLDRMERKYHKMHLQRVNEKNCTGNLSIVYVDLLSDIERMGDHFQNIAEYMTNSEEVLTSAFEDQNITELLEEIRNEIGDTV